MVAGTASEAEQEDEVEAFELTMETSLLWDAFDDFQDRIEEDGFNRTLMAGFAFLLATAGSIAYVIWTVWGGYLLGSVMALMPHWQLIDPLPILNEEDDALEEHDGESLESIATKTSDNELSRE